VIDISWTPFSNFDGKLAEEEVKGEICPHVNEELEIIFCMHCPLAIVTKAKMVNKIKRRCCSIEIGEFSLSRGELNGEI